MSKKTAAASPVGATSQTNVVTITDQSNLITSISYVGGSLKVSEGQPTLVGTAGKANVPFGLPCNRHSFPFTPFQVYPAHNIPNVFVLMLETPWFDTVSGLPGLPTTDAATSADSNTYNGTPYPVAP